MNRQHRLRRSHLVNGSSDSEVTAWQGPRAKYTERPPGPQTPGGSIFTEFRKPDTAQQARRKYGKLWGVGGSAEKRERVLIQGPSHPPVAANASDRVSWWSNV